MISNCTREMHFFPVNFMLQTNVHIHEDDYHHQPSTSLSTLDIPPPQEFHGVASFMGKRSLLFSAGIHHHYHQQHEFFHEEGNGNRGAQMDDLSDDDDESQAGREKKRRLNLEQVKTLEKNFELANKLEPDKKLQLARALGLQPRQIAIWFQNRRARWKTKQLEKEYQLLKREFDAIKAENDSLQSQNHKLHAQILALKNGEATESINLNKETEGSCSENSSDIIKLDISTRTGPATDSHPNITRRPFFQSDRQPSDHVAQLFQNDNNNQKTEHHQPESLCNMFCGIDDQTGYWPWLEHQQFN